MTDAPDRDASALHWATVLKIGTSLFKYIPEGGLFCLNSGPDAEVFRKKGNAGWFTARGGGRRYRTGMRTAVFPVKEGEVPP